MDVSVKLIVSLWSLKELMTSWRGKKSCPSRVHLDSLSGNLSDFVTNLKKNLLRGTVCADKQRSSPTADGSFLK